MDLARAIAAAYPGAIVQVPAGIYAVNLVLTKPVTLLALGEVVLDGTTFGSVVRVDCAAGVVRLSGFTLVNGVAADAGGGLSVFAGTVELKRCVLRLNRAPLDGGGGVYVASGRTTLRGCRIEGNTGRQGGGVLVDGDAVVELLDCTVIQNAAIQGGGLRVKEGATLQLVGCTVADNKVVSGPAEYAEGSALYLSGSTSRAPAVSVVNSIISERVEGPSCVFNSKAHPAALEVRASLLPAWCKALGGDNLFGAPRFSYSGKEPYRLEEGSPAIGAADVARLSSGASDVLGGPRVSGSGRATLGAFAS